MAYDGIDYSGGLANFDPKTGIRFGVISQYEVTSEALDDVEYDYDPATCGECGDEANDLSEEKGNEDIPDLDELPDDWTKEPGCADYACLNCKRIFDSSDAFPEESNGWTYKKDGYALDSSETDIFVTKSLYYSFGTFCSPCAPGAVSLGTSGGIKAYCLGHDWFDEGVAPYKIYLVADDTIVEPKGNK